MNKLPFKFFIFLFYLLFSSAFCDQNLPAGVEYKLFTLENPNKVHVLKIDRKSPEFKLKLGLSNQQRNYPALETTSKIYSRYSGSAEYETIGAINGGFFSEGIIAAGFMASDCNLIQFSKINWDTFALTEAGECLLSSSLTLKEAKLILSDTSTYDISVLNAVRPVNSIACYTSDWGKTTKTNSEGAEIILQNVNLPFRANKEISGIVSDIKLGASSKDNIIPLGGLVISSREDIAKEITAKVKIGDRLKLKFRLSEQVFNNASFMITGGGVLLLDGKKNTTFSKNLSKPYIDNKNPRTAIAWNHDNLYLVVADGRSATSIGMSFSEFADFLLNELKAENAVNLDGGGSSTMVVKGNIVNHPSDSSGERVVADSVILIRVISKTDSMLCDSFPKTGKEYLWDEKFRFNPLKSLSPPSPGGDGYVLSLKNNFGGFETARAGKILDSDYCVSADVYCENRKSDASKGYERYGIFVRDNGNAAFSSKDFGGGFCYIMAFETHNGKIRTSKIKKGELLDFTPTKQILIKQTGWHNFKISCVGEKIDFFLDNKLILSQKDSDYKYGFYGIGYHEFFSDKSLIHGACIDNFVMTPYNSTSPTSN